MNTPPSAETCANCGTAVDQTTLGGLCPRCVALDFLAAAPDSPADDLTSLLEEDERRLGDYELLEEISRGGMGVVFLARQISLGRNVAVKMILHGVLAGDNAIARFKEEAAAAAALSHPNIVAIHEIGEDRGRLFFSMEYVKGRTLAEILRDGPMPARVAAACLERVAAAVHYAHQRGVLHRDLKPSNILIDSNGQPRVTDFGLAKRFDSQSDLTLTGQVIGTPGYMSPEQAGGPAFAEVGSRSDIYSLGALLYHAICGFAPFTGESVTEVLHKVTGLEPVAPRVLNPALPRDLETICLKCLAKDPSRRYASALELSDDLSRFLKGEPIHARPVGPVEKVWRWSRRQPALAAALVGCGAILIAGIGGILWQLRQTNAAKAVAIQKAKDEETQRIAAQHSELVMRQNLYTADMLAAQRALDLNDLGSARLLLNNHRPTAGQPDLRSFEWRYLWGRAQGDPCTVLVNGVKSLWTVSFSPDGKWLACAGDQVQLYDVATCQVRAQLSLSNVYSIAFFPDSSSLLLGMNNPSEVRRWDWQRGGEPSEFIDPHSSWPRVAISPAGDVVVVACGSDILASEPEGTTALYDSVTGKFRCALPKSGGHAAFSPDGSLLATGSGEGRIKLWNPVTGEFVRALTNAVRAQTLTFSPDGRTLAVCAPLESGLSLYDISTGAQRPFAAGNFCCVWGAAFSPDGETLATPVTDQTVRLWDTKSGRQTARFLGHIYQVACAAWSPDGKLLASGGGDGTVRLWDVAAATGGEAVIPGEVQSRLISGDGKQIALTQHDGAVCIRELPSLSVVGPSQQIGVPLGFLPDSKGILSIRWPATNGPGEVVWWRLPEYEFVKKISVSEAGSPDAIRQLSPDGRFLAASGEQGDVRILDLADDGKSCSRLSVPGNGFVQALSFSPDGRRLGMTFLRSTAGYIWDMKPDHTPLAIQGLVGLAILFSKDGSTVYGTGINGLTYWDAATGNELSHVLGRWGGVDCLDISPDGKTLAFPARGAVRFWNIVTRREVARFETSPQDYSVAFEPDGNAIFITENTTNGPVTTVKRAPAFQQTDLRL